MGRRRLSGLRKRKNGVWHLDKVIFGKRICESTGTESLEEAEKYLAHRIEELREAIVFGVRPKRTFRDAAIKYISEDQKVSIIQKEYMLKTLDPYIGDLPLEAVHMGSLQQYIADRKKSGVRNRTINYALQVVRHLLNLAAGEWLDENGLTWLQNAPKIKLLSETDKRKPYPITWEEQEKLFAELPRHLQQMALFAVNTGCRDREMCQLRWDWECRLPNSDDVVFIIPGELIKNREDKLGPVYI